jgi:hypothetical protein
LQRRGPRDSGSSYFKNTSPSIAAITLAEIYYGIEKLPVKKKERRTKIEQIHSILEIHPCSSFFFLSVERYHLKFDENPYG